MQRKTQARRGIGFDLALGTELGETDFWYETEGLDLKGELIRVDIDPRQLSRNAAPTLPVLADAGRFAEALTPLLLLEAGEAGCPNSAHRAGSEILHHLKV